MARSRVEAQEQVNEALRHKQRTDAAVANVQAEHDKPMYCTQPPCRNCKHGMPCRDNQPCPQVQ